MEDKMKKILAILIVMTLALSACAPKANQKESLKSDPVDVRVVALKGPTGMGLAKFMDEEPDETYNNFSFELVGAVDEIPPKIIQGNVDIAAVPANLASILYNNTQGEVQVLAVNTLGVLYIVENGSSVKSLQDLKGKTLYASGKGATPEYALNHLLKQAGVDPEKDITIEWKSEHAEVVAAMTAEQNAIGLLPQPFVTVAQAKNENIKMAVDLNTQWEELNKNSDSPLLITGAFVVRREFAEANPQAVKEFMDHYHASQKFVNENLEEASLLMEKFDIIKAPIAQKAIPYCYIVDINGVEMKKIMGGYLKILKEANPKSIGGNLPGEDFYYGQEK